MAITVTAWAKTLRRIRRWEVLAEPPFAMFHRPLIRIRATMAHKTRRMAYMAFPMVG